jgi:hypothetical protein
MSSPEKQLKIQKLFATKVVVALVDSPLYDNNIDRDQIDNFFKNYFQITRTHKLNDRIFIKNNLNPSKYIESRRNI